MRLRLAILDDYQSVALDYAPWEQLAADGVEVTVFTRPFRDDADAVTGLRDFDIIIAMRERTAFGRERLRQLPGLKLLVTTGMANQSIDLQAAEEQGIMVCGTGGSPAAAPELTWALLLAFARSIPFEDRRLRAGRWQSTVGFELAGKTLGVLGLGKIGTRIAAYGRAFGMDVIAWSPNLTDEAASQAGARKVSKDALFRESDVVSVHVRLSERSRGVVGEEELRLLGPTGVLVNTARGPLVDEDALVRGLDGRLARRRRPGCLRRRTVARRPSPAVRTPDRSDAASGVRHGAELPAVLRRRLRRRAGLAPEAARSAC